MNEQKQTSFDQGKNIALYLGGAVYAGVVLLFLAFYTTLMASRFSGFLSVVATIGAVLVAANAIALPVALHFWTVTRGHKVLASVFYGGDIILMSLNVLVAANTSAGTLPAWLVTYSTYAPASIIFVLATWAMLYMFDPGQKSLIEIAKAKSEAELKIINLATTWLASDKGQATIEAFAGKMAAQMFSERSLLGAATNLPVNQQPTQEETQKAQEMLAQFFGMDGKSGIPIVLRPPDDGSTGKKGTDGNTHPT